MSTTTSATKSILRRIEDAISDTSDEGYTPGAIFLGPEDMKELQSRMQTPDGFTAGRITFGEGSVEIKEDRTLSAGAMLIYGSKQVGSKEHQP